MLMNPAESGCVPEAGSKPLSTKATSQAFAVFFFCISEVSFIFIYTLGQWDFFSVVQCCGCKRGDSGLRATWGLSSFFFFFADFDEKNDDCVSVVITHDNNDRGDVIYQ